MKWSAALRFHSDSKAALSVASGLSAQQTSTQFHPGVEIKELHKQPAVLLLSFPSGLDSVQTIGEKDL